MSKVNSFVDVLIHNLSGYSHSFNFCQIMALCAIGKFNVLFYGPGGYAKTDMIMLFLKSIKGASSGKLECSSRTTSDDLFGGSIARTEIFKVINSVSEASDEAENLRKIQEERIFADIYWEKGLLSKNYFFLDEALDPPTDTLTDLKAVLTHREMRGHKSKHQIVIGATNKDPYQMLESVPYEDVNSLEALLQRFLVVEQVWESHTEDDYYRLSSFHNPELQYYAFEDLLRDQQKALQVELGENEERLLCSLSAKSTELGSRVSPRTHMWVKRALKVQAFINEKSEVSEREIVEVVPLFKSYHQSIVSEFQEELERHRRIIEMKHDLEKVSLDLEKIIDYAENAKVNKHFRYLNAVHNLDKLNYRLSSIQVNDACSSIKANLADKIQKLIRKYKDLAADEVVYHDII